MPDQKSPRGGARKGAGRKKGSRNANAVARRKLQIVLPASLVDRLEEITKTKGTPKSWLVKEALEAYLDK